jgi:hypothetical protein
MGCVELVAHGGDTESHTCLRVGEQKQTAAPDWLGKLLVTRSPSRNLRMSSFTLLLFVS